MMHHATELSEVAQAIPFLTCTWLVFGWIFAGTTIIPTETFYMGFTSSFRQILG
jgi:hypothetical protein